MLRGTPSSARSVHRGGERRYQRLHEIAPARHNRWREAVPPNRLGDDRADCGDCRPVQSSEQPVGATMALLGTPRRRSRSARPRPNGAPSQAMLASRRSTKCPARLTALCSPALRVSYWRLECRNEQCNLTFPRRALRKAPNNACFRGWLP